MIPPSQLLTITFLLFLSARTADAALASVATTVEYVAGQRCLFVPRRAAKDEDKASPPPVVILGGMAQSIPSWEPHVPSFSQSRDVLLYEARGQGPPRDDNENNNDNASLFLQDVSLPAQAKYLMETLDELDDRMTNDNDQVDLVGFSLGGRIALATCLLYPHRIRKVHLTGVAADRSPLGHLTVESWKDHVQNDQGNLRSFAWSVLLATYSPTTMHYWQQNRDYLETILNFVTQQNTAQGLTALLQQTHSADLDHEWSTLSMARRFASMSADSQLNIQGHACVGQLDHDMAPVEQVERLCQELQWEKKQNDNGGYSCPTILPNCGHAAPMEQPRQWRQHVLEFLNS